mmetsp:Transcript_27520/g.72536  ORF Transcript_27520/g.72536 Transcript_27520/m.72536 type:complete len:161 (+) Transcript_27520:2635-3117(+)
MKSNEFTASPAITMAVKKKAHAWNKRKKNNNQEAYKSLMVNHLLISLMAIVGTSAAFLTIALRTDLRDCNRFTGVDSAESSEWTEDDDEPADTSDMARERAGPSDASPLFKGSASLLSDSLVRLRLLDPGGLKGTLSVGPESCDVMEDARARIRRLKNAT